MIIYKYLYLSETTKKNAKKIIRKLKQNAGMVSTYVIMLASNDKDLFDICHSAVLMQPFYKNNPPFIVGLATGKEEAMLMVEDIVQDIFNQSGSYENMRQFILSKQSEVG